MSAKNTPQRKNALGRGLNALLKDAPFLAGGAPTNPIQEIHIDQIEVNPFQPRKDFAPTALQELADSIELHGIIQPLTVRQLAPSRYQLIAGERRLQASKLVNLTHVPAYIRTANDQQMLEIALVENIQRENLNPIEIALSYQQLLSECNIKQEALAARVGKDRATVNNYLRLLKLPPDIQIALRDQKISMGHARALITVGSVNAQLAIFKEILKKALSVRSVEAMVRALSQENTPKQVAPERIPTKFISTTKSASTQLTRQLATPVKIHVGEKERGEIKITFASENEFKRLLNILVEE
jgi:ParB family chromosome partitioning protein